MKKRGQSQKIKKNSKNSWYFVMKSRKLYKIPGQIPVFFVPVQKFLTALVTVRSCLACTGTQICTGTRNLTFYQYKVCTGTHRMFCTGTELNTGTQLYFVPVQNRLPRQTKDLLYRYTDCTGTAVFNVPYRVPSRNFRYLCTGRDPCYQCNILQ